MQTREDQFKKGALSFACMPVERGMLNHAQGLKWTRGALTHAKSLVKKGACIPKHRGLTTS